MTVQVIPSGTKVIFRLPGTQGPPGNTPDGSISTVKLADGAATNPKLADDAVDSRVLADDSVTTAAIADGAVGAAAIDDGAVTPAKLDRAYAESASLATVATTGAYADLIGKPTPTLVNLLTANVSTGTDTLGTTEGFVPGINTTLVSSDASAWTGTRSLLVAATDAEVSVYAGTLSTGLAQIAVTAGQTYSALAWVRSESATRSVALRLNWRQADQATPALTSSSQGSGVQLSPEWKLVQVTVVAPADAEWVSVQLVQDTDFTAGESFYTDGWTFYSASSSVVFGTTASTAAEGNDARIVGAAQVADLSTVATSGAYADLSGTPTLGTAAEADTGDFATAAQGAAAETAVQPTVVDAKGDLLVGTAADTVARLPVGTDGQVLTADSTEAGGVKWSESLGGVPNVVFQGDSLTATVNAGENHADLGPLVYGTSMPHFAINGITANATVKTYASFGKQVGAFPPDAPTGMNAEGATIDAQLVSGANNVVVLFGGTNDLGLGGQTASVVYDRIVAFCSARKAAGWKVVVCTLLPRTDPAAPADFETSRTTINDSLRANYTTYADALADLAADSLMGVAGASDNATWYSDKLHLQQAGRQRIGRIVGQALANVGVIIAATPLVDQSIISLPGRSGLGIGGVANAGGRAPLSSLTTGKANTVVGSTSGGQITTGNYNTAVGTNALGNASTGDANTALGWYAGLGISTGSNNVVLGSQAGQSLASASGNTLVGKGAGESTTSNNNTAIGNTALGGSTTGGGNVAIGNAAGSGITSGSACVAIGSTALGTGPVTASDVVGIGYFAGRYVTSGSQSVFIGSQAGALPAGTFDWHTNTGTRQTVIGHTAGQGSATQRNDIVTIGWRALADANKATAIGSNAKANHTASVALGADTTTSADSQVMLGSRDVEITDSTRGVILRSPDGTRYRITVADGGTINVATA